MADATKQCREEMDTLAAFFEDRCVIREGLMTPARRLYKQYQMWCDDAWENAETQKMFGMRLSERGFVRSPKTRMKATISLLTALLAPAMVRPTAPQRTIVRVARMRILQVNQPAQAAERTIQHVSQ